MWDVNIKTSFGVGLLVKTWDSSIGELMCNLKIACNFFKKSYLVRAQTINFAQGFEPAIKFLCKKIMLGTAANLVKIFSYRWTQWTRKTIFGMRNEHKK